MRARKCLVALTFLLFGALSFLTACEQGASLSGIWIGALVIPPSESGEGGVFTLNLELTQEGTTLSGQAGLEQVPAFSFLVPITSGSFSGDSVSIRAEGTFLLEGYPLPVALFLTGSYNMAGLSGEGTYTAGGHVYQATWSAHRI